jgi:hypothetical protein
MAGTAAGLAPVESNPQRSYAALFDGLCDEREKGQARTLSIIQPKVRCSCLIFEVSTEWQSAMLRALEMLPRSNSSSYRARAAVSAWCAEQTASAETAASLLYLEQMWLLVADVAEIIEGNRSRAAPDSDLHYLSRE